jgi:DNA helicase II / ATP-dependent DNA helicase PcrA
MGEKKLNQAQQKAVMHPGGPLLIVAGAGTGKTTVIVERMLWLLQDQQHKPEQILALTFTDKAANEMIERIDAELPYGYRDLWVSTFHSFCERVLREYGIDIGLPNEFRLLTPVDAWVLMRKNFDVFHLNYYRPLGNPAKFIRALLDHFSRCKDEAIFPEEYIAHAEDSHLDTDEELGTGSRKGDGISERARLTEVATAYHAYQQLLLLHNALDFGDLLLYTLKLFRQRPNILDHYRTQFAHILVDEFQDTNWAQYEIVKRLAEPNRNMTIVADDDQSIYAWRGASMSNILHFKEDYPETTSVVLTENYRSKQHILDTAYALITKNNPNRLEITLREEKLSKRLNAARGAGGILERIHAATESEEAMRVATTIIKQKTPEMSWSDIAILVRANRHAEPFLRALDRHGIPYQFLASRGLFGKPVVLDCLAYLKLLDNYHESSAFYRILTSPVVDMREEDIITLMHEAGKRNRSLYAIAQEARALDVSEEAKTQCATLLGWIEAHTQQARTKTVGEVLYAFLDDSLYLADLTSAVQHPGDVSLKAHDRIQDVHAFFQELIAFEQLDAEPTVKQFLETFAIRQEAGDTGTLSHDIDLRTDTVKVMTIHSAKGLEFHTVFVPQLVELRFPSVHRREPIAIPDELIKDIIPKGNTHLEEERRLLYVAMTRAKDALFLTYADDYGGQRKKKPSVFLKDLDLEATVQPHNAQLGLAGIADFAQPATKPEVRVTHAIPNRFSFTQLNAFETCPLQYKFAHILKIPSRGRYSFSFGRSMHRALEQFFKQRMRAHGSLQQGLFHDGDNAAKPTREALLALYDAAWVSEWYESTRHEEEYKKKGREMLMAFYDRHEEEWPETIAVEQPFTIRIGGDTIKGAIDRIDLVDDGIRIVDYKTGKTPKSERTVPKAQLLLYQLAAEETMDRPVKSLVFSYLSDQTDISFLGSEEDVTAFQEHVRETIAKIKQSDFTPTPSAQVCRNCDFRDICEYKAV